MTHSTRAPDAPTPPVPAPRDSAEGGFALAVAIFALVVVGVLVTGGFFVARQESRIGVANTNAQTAFYMAENGIANVMDSVSAQQLTSLAIWDTVTVSDTVADGITDVLITRTATRTYLLDGTSHITGRGHLGGGTRRLGVIAKLFTALIDPPAALATTGNLKIGGSSEINGYDSVPDGWDSYCDASDTTSKPGVIINDLDSISYSGSTYKVDGDPKTAEDQTLTPDSLLVFGDLTWDDLVAMADVYLDAPELNNSNNISPAPATMTLPDGTVVCNIANEANWGDPLNPDGPCGSYFPILYADAAHSTPLKLQGNNVGQGILLVEGDLQMSGGFVFYGPVIVKGTFSTSGTGGHVQGGVIASNAYFDQTEVLGNAVVQYSTCGVKRALLGNNNLTRLVPMASRNWIDLSNIGN